MSESTESAEEEEESRKVLASTFFCSVQAPGLLLKEITEIIHHTGFPVEVDHLEAVHSLHGRSRDQPCCPAVSIVSAVQYSISL